MKNNVRLPHSPDAVVLLSGGLDSAVTLYYAQHCGFSPLCLIFDYGQRHRKEIEAAKKVARAAAVPYRVLAIRLPWKGSSLLDKGKIIPVRAGSRKPAETAIPSTYVPARNTIFLSFALSCAESIGAKAIFIGAHAQDYSGYPDCRPEYYRAYEKVIARGTKAGVEGAQVRIITPLIRLGKAGIIRLGASLGVPFALTWSCYRGGRRPCGTCDSCYYRAKGFRDAQLPNREPLLAPKQRVSPRKQQSR